MSELPNGWTAVQLGEITRDCQQQVPGSDREFYYVDISAIDRDTKIIVNPQRMTGRDAPSRARKLIRSGDVLVSMTRPNLNAVALVPDELNDQIASTGFDVLRSISVEPRWVFNNVRTRAFIEQMTNLVQGALYPAVRSKDIRGYVIPIAPINEQKRIADKLDSLLARVDTCRERLDRVPGILKRFRQAVLAAATNGELTREWRGESKEHLPEQTPRTWSRCLTKEAGRIQLGRQRSPKYHSGSNMRPYLRVQNIFEDRIDLSDVMEMDFPGEDFERYKLHPGDILLNEGQSPEFLGRPALYNGELPDACFTNTLIRFQAHEFVSPNFALLVFRHYMHAGRFSSEGTITTNIAHLGAGRFGNIEFPLPSLAEQAEIVRRATILLSFADHCENEVKRGRSAADRLTPSLLSKAFRGELVPQDPNDEPASELLARIRAAGTEQPMVKRGRKAGAR